LSQQGPGKKYPIDRVKAILEMNRALWGEVSPALRAARIDWNEQTIHLFFYYDGEISEEDHESAECVATEVIASYPEYELQIDVLRWDYPQPVPASGELVYCRREPSSPATEEKA
jgi:hypothetical protein